MEELYGPLIASTEMPGSGAGFVTSYDDDGIRTFKPYDAK